MQEAPVIPIGFSRNMNGVGRSLVRGLMGSLLGGGRGRGLF